ncbi:MAG: histidine phosphatase family protein [Limosilactobacillus sp.]|uniref:histidine phosphatase family protein n=1 Tax=Limosilactobacillus sp. TaxID=2773925 RepID=UPI0027095665|nr:histidine phosphatase family protein [Limosilactobacillus sp.]
MTKLNLYLVRHGQTYYNIYNKLQGWSNSPLTDKGKENATAAGERLKDIHFAAAFCSDTTRAMETIQTILDLNQADSVKSPKTSPYFREEFYGSYEGTNMDVAWYNAGAPHGFKTFKDIVTAHSIGTAKDWLKDADPFHDAENNQEYWARVDKGIELIKNADLPDGANVLWVSHGNTLLSLVERFGEGKYDVTVRPDNGSLTKMCLDDGKMTIVEYNK